MKSYTYEELDSLNKDQRKTEGHCIILEGIDGCGKTTIANRIKNDYPEMNYEIIHCGRDTENNLEFFKNIFGKAKNYIFDRAMYGQFVYQTREERKKNGWLSLSDLESLEAIMRTCKFEIIYVSTDLNTCYRNCKKDSQDSYYTMDYVKLLDEKFRYMFDTITTYVEPVCLKNPYILGDQEDSEEIKSEDVKTFDYASLPEIIAVDFDGCLATDCFPHIENAKPNLELIEALKKRQRNGSRIILWTCRTHDGLIDACNFCANYGLYFDAVNENVKEVAEPLAGGPKKVYASMYLDDKAKRIVYKG